APADPPHRRDPIGGSGRRNAEERLRSRTCERRVTVATNLVNLFEVSKDYAARTILRDVTLGITAGERIGMVGQNGQGKSTLLKLIAGSEEPDSGAVVRTRGLNVGVL